jgi:hypothetical protein
MPGTMTAVELRSLIAAQIAAALIRDLPKNTPASAMTTVAEAAVRMAKEIEAAADRSLRT